MRICILSPDRPSQGLNGPRRIAEEGAPALAGLGHEVHLIGSTEAEPRVQRADGVRRHAVNVADRGLRGLEDCAVAMDLYAAAAKYREVANLHVSAPVDLVAATIWPGEGLLCMLDPRLLTVTVLVTPVKLMVDRGMLAGEPFETTARMEAAVAERATDVHATSAAIVEDVQATFGVTLAASAVAPLFIADRGASTETERCADADEVEVLFVGRPEPRKGADVLVAAARQLAEECADAVFVLVGWGDWGPLRAEVEQAGLGARFRFPEEVNEERLWRLYAGADIVCVPSRYESFGYSLIEGMMFGKPIVATSSGGMTSTVEEGGNALLCPPDDAVSLARCLVRLIVDRDLRAAYGRRSRELYAERYSAVRGGERTAALYESIVASYGERDAWADAEDGRAPDTRVADALGLAVSEIADLDPVPARELAGALLEDPVADPQSGTVPERGGRPGRRRLTGPLRRLRTLASQRGRS